MLNHALFIMLSHYADIILGGALLNDAVWLQREKKGQRSGKKRLHNIPMLPKFNDFRIVAVGEVLLLV